MPGQLPYNVRIYLGGVWLNPTYSGRSGCCAGVDQINFVIPDNLYGCYIPLAVEVEGVLSNFTSISIAPQGQQSCSSNLSFPQEVTSLATDPNRILKIGALSLMQNRAQTEYPGLGQVTTTTDIADAGFSRVSAATLANAALLTQDIPSGCTVIQIKESGAVTVEDPTIEVDTLDAGSQLTLQGPGGTRSLTKQSDDSYTWNETFFQLPPGTPPPPIPIPGITIGDPFLRPGSYSLSAPGGADVSAFQYNFQIPTFVQWTNKPSSNQTIPRTQDLVFTWTNGQPNQWVYIFGSSGFMVGESNFRGAIFYCITEGTAGTFIVPSMILQQLPPSGVVSDVPLGTLGLGTYQVLPPAKPDGLDVFAGQLITLEGASVKFE